MTYHNIFDLVLDSNDVSTGGGSSAALSGAMAAGLIAMVSKLSINKDFGLSNEEYMKIAEDCESIKLELLNGSIEDAEAYGFIVSSYKFPKNTPEEKSIRQQKISEAGIKAASIPKKNAINCKKLYDLGTRLKNNSNKNAESDLQFGIELSKIAVNGCISNIVANMRLIKDDCVIEELNNSIKILELK